jgi:predicted extracellular nuclease
LDGETSNATAAVPFPIGTYGNIAQPVQLIYEPFDSGLGAFTAYSVTGAQEWGTAPFGNPPPSAKMSGFDGALFENEDWLISPSLDLTDVSGIELSFDEAINYEPDVAGNCQVLISSDYIGSGDPNTATWTIITMPVRAPGDNWNFLNTEIAATNEFDGEPSVYLAFRYTSTVSAAGTWELDNIHLEATETVGGDPPLTFIHDIQGSGAESPLINNEVMIEGIVVADFQDTNIEGFFVQEEDADVDSDPATSEGIFVYSTTSVDVGDMVQVSGTVKEYFGLTELSSITNIVIVAVGQTLPTPATVELPFSDDLFPERYEGMSVFCPQTLTISETFNLGRYGEVVLSDGRLFIPTNVVDPGPDAIAMQVQNDLNKILLDDGNTLQNVDPILFGLNGNPLTADNTLRCGDQATGVNGVLTYSWSGSFGTDAYRIHPTETVYFTEVNPRTATPADVGGSLKVASFNVLNYFNGDGQGGGFPTSRGADDLEEFDRQRDKIIAAIDIMNADIIGLMEIENDGYGPFSAIQDLVNGLNAYTSGNSYAFIDPGVSQIGTDEIAVGILYRPETVTSMGVSRILDNTVDPTFNSDANRPCLAQSFVEIATGGVVTVAVNHLKSKGSACPGDPDTGDGQGNCNLTRTAAAEAIVNWLGTDPTDSGVDNYLIIGDLNSYAKEDPITAIKNAGYTDLVDLYNTAAYSYVFSGQAGYLDHALASSNVLEYVSGATVWHINADEPRVLDYDKNFKTTNQHIILYNPDQYRASDHDPVMVGIKFPTLVTLDVKPASWPNPINIKSNGVTPMAILGSDEFDVSTIDVESLYLDLPEGTVEPVNYAYEDVAQPAGTAWECNDTEDGADGYMDLTLKFNTQDLVAGLGEVNDGDELVILIKGSIINGPDLEGDDCILILKKGKGGFKSAEIETAIFSLDQNYPNPCSSTTIIPFEIPEASHVVLKVLDVLGNEVAVLADKNFDAGSHSVEFDAGRLAGGIYFYRIQTADHTATRQMLVNE